MVKEELPPGWKEFVRLRNGKKIKYYSLEEDGKKFYSKVAVMRYVNGNSTLQPQTDTGCNNTPQPQGINCNNTPQSRSDVDCNNTPQPPSEIGCNNTPQPHSEVGCKNTPQPQIQMDCNNAPQPRSEMNCNNTAHQQNEHGKTGSKSGNSGSAKSCKQVPWLPPGWITEVNTKQSGATYKVYIDPATGAKFYSKPQVLRYLGTVSLGDTIKENKNTITGKASSEAEACEGQGLLKSQSYGSEKEMGSGIMHSTPVACSNTIEVASVDGLTDEWSKEIRTKDTAGKIRKDVNTITGKASSEAEACEGQGLLKSQSCASEKEMGSGITHSTPIACLNTIEVGSVDGLPHGWSKEIRTKDIAGKIRKDVYYKDPVSGFLFRSKKDALRYIETGDCSRCKLKPKKIEEANLESTEAHAPFDKIDIYLEKIDVSEHYIVGKSQNSISREEEINKLFEDTVEAVKPVESTAVDGLPPGWIKELKSRKDGKRKDTFYVDPISGYMFWSKLDALRYIESGDISKCACKPRKKGAYDNESTQHVDPLSPVGQRYSMQSTSEQLLVRDGLNQGKQNFDTSNLKVETESSNRIQENSSSVTGLTNIVSEVTPNKSLRKRQRKPRKSPQISEIRPEGSEQEEVRTASSTGAVVLNKQEPVTGVMEQKAGTPASRSDSKRSRSVPGRMSKRLAGIHPETPPNLQLSERSLRSTTRKFREGEVNALPAMTIDANSSVSGQPVHSKLDLVSADTFHEPKFAKDMDKQKHGGSSQKRDQGVHGRASKRLAGCQPEMPPNLQLSERSLRAAMRMACEDETTILPMITTNAVPSVLLQPRPSHPNLPLLDANASLEQKLTNDDVQLKDGNNTPTGLTNSNNRKAESASSRTSKRPAAQSVPRRTSKRPVAATPGRSSKRLAGSQIETSRVIAPNSVPSVLPQPLQPEPLPGTSSEKFTQGGRPAFPIDAKHIFDASMEPLNIERAPDVAEIVSMVVESISKMDEIEMSELPSVNDQSVSEMKLRPKYAEASVGRKTVSVDTGIQLNEKPAVENAKPPNLQGSYLSVVDSWSDPCLDFAFKTLTGAISLEDTLSYQGCSQPQDNAYSVHGNGQFRQSGSHNIASSQQNIPSHFQGTLAYHGSSQAQNTPVVGENASFGRSETHNHVNFQQHGPSSFTLSRQHVQVEQPRNPSIPPGFDGVPPYRGVRNNPDTRNKDYKSYTGTNK